MHATFQMCLFWLIPPERRVHCKFAMPTSCVWCKLMFGHFRICRDRVLAGSPHDPHEHWYQFQQQVGSRDANSLHEKVFCIPRGSHCIQAISYGIGDATLASDRIAILLYLFGKPSSPPRVLHCIHLKLISATVKKPKNTALHQGVCHSSARIKPSYLTIICKVVDAAHVSP